MRKIPYYLVFLGLLAACSDGGTPTCVGPNGACGFDGLTPDPNRFIDPAANSNKQVTMMISLNEAQITAYIKNKLAGYTGETPENYLNVAQAALDIASGEDISNIPEESMAPAMYVVSPNLFASCGGASDVSTCISDWGAANSKLLAQRLVELRARADELNIAEVDFSNTIEPDSVLTFSVDENGKIIGVTVDGVSYDRNGNTNSFSNADGTLVYKSGTLDPSLEMTGLSYSDFGIYTITDSSGVNKVIPFAGGYTSQKIAENDIQTAIGTDVKFSGAALGVVTNSDNEQLDIADNRASLLFSKDTGQTTLSASFDNWYDISVVKDMNDTTANINFSDYTGTDNYKLPDDILSGTASMDVGYYGATPETGIPTEATGLVNYSGNGINMDVSFGVK